MPKRSRMRVPNRDADAARARTLRHHRWRTSRTGSSSTSGPDAEVVELAERAAELRADGTLILVVSPQRPSRLPVRAQWRDVYPVGPYLTHAEGIVTAAGFNAMRETAELRARHCVVPFTRPLDDQFARA